MARQYSRIEEELARIKEGEMKHVRTGPGRQGLMTIEGGRKGLSIVESLDENMKQKRKARVIKGVRAVAPAGYN